MWLPKAYQLPVRDPPAAQHCQKPHVRESQPLVREPPAVPFHGRERKTQTGNSGLLLPVFLGVPRALLPICSPFPSIVWIPQPSTTGAPESDASSSLPISPRDLPKSQLLVSGVLLPAFLWKVFIKAPPTPCSGLSCYPTRQRTWKPRWWPSLQLQDMAQKTVHKTRGNLLQAVQSPNRYW